MRSGLRYGSMALPVMGWAQGALADPESGFGAYGHGMMWGDQWGGFGMVLGPIFMVLLLVGLIAAVIYVLRTFAPHSMAPPAPNGDRALAILRERLAKGEIELEEFEARKKALTD